MALSQAPITQPKVNALFDPVVIKKCVEQTRELAQKYKKAIQNPSLKAETSYVELLGLTLEVKNDLFSLRFQVINFFHLILTIGIQAGIDLKDMPKTFSGLWGNLVEEHIHDLFKSVCAKKIAELPLSTVDSHSKINTSLMTSETDEKMIQKMRKMADDINECIQAIDKCKAEVKSDKQTSLNPLLELHKISLIFFTKLCNAETRVKKEDKFIHRIFSIVRYLEKLAPWLKNHETWFAQQPALMTKFKDHFNYYFALMCKESEAYIKAGGKIPQKDTNNYVWYIIKIVNERAVEAMLFRSSFLSLSKLRSMVEFFAMPFGDQERMKLKNVQFRLKSLALNLQEKHPDIQPLYTALIAEAKEPIPAGKMDKYLWLQRFERTFNLFVEMGIKANLTLQAIQQLEALTLGKLENQALTDVLLQHRGKQANSTKEQKNDKPGVVASVSPSQGSLDPQTSAISATADQRQPSYRP